MVTIGYKLYTPCSILQRESKLFSVNVPDFRL